MSTLCYPLPDTGTDVLRLLVQASGAGVAAKAVLQTWYLLRASRQVQLQTWLHRNTPSTFSGLGLLLLTCRVSTGGQCCLKHCTQSPRILRLMKQGDGLIPGPPLRYSEPQDPLESPFCQNSVLMLNRRRNKIITTYWEVASTTCSRSNSAKLRAVIPSRTRDTVCRLFCTIFHAIGSSAGENTTEGRVTNSSEVTKERTVDLWSAFLSLLYRENLPFPEPRNCPIQETSCLDHPVVRKGKRTC